MGGGLSGRPHHDFLRHHVNNTRMMADAIAEEYQRVDPNVASENLQRRRAAIKTRSSPTSSALRGVLVGTSTANNVMMPKIAGWWKR